ncbi:hypothetical protein COB55_05720 [Candidatus Wolfebacteria bacterium]|nr:MAG: hypothetical protein COB55_05720 [Candidatus Wolfebacteria bacterium]
MAKHNVVGAKGEMIAIKFLKRKGFNILDTNYSRKWGELDIVAKREGRIHFVEVKTSSRDLRSVTCVTEGIVSRETFGLDSVGYRPEENMHYHKKERLKRVIQTYLIDKRMDSEFQVDLVVVYLDDVSKKAVVDYLPNILL